MLRKLSIILGLSLITLQVMAESALKLTPSICKDISKVADIWVNATNATKTDLRKYACKDSFSGKVLRVLAKGNRPQGFFINYKFTVKNSGKYKFYGALIHQGIPYGSIVEFRFDNEKWRKIVPIKGPRSSWGISRAINWELLDTVNLTAGEHTLDFRAKKPAANGMWSVMCDGIIGFDVKKKVEISDFISLDDIKPGSVSRFKFQSSGSGLGKVELKLADSIIKSINLLITPGENQFGLTIPACIGGNVYSVQIYPAFGGESPWDELHFTIPPPKSQETPVVLKTAKVTDSSFHAILEASNEEKRTILAFLFIDQKLYHVDIITIKAGEKSISGKFSNKFKTLSAGRNCIIKFMGAPGIPGGKATVTHKFPGKSSHLPKPMNYGIFTDSSFITHPWFINHHWQYIFDGKPYFPVGGMWCSNTLICRGTTEKGINTRIAHDLKTLRGIKKHRIDDVYLNLSHVAPIWVRQYFLDMLERENIYYGYQLNGGGKGDVPSFFITRDIKNAPGNWKGLVHGKYENGKIKAELPKTYKIMGLLVVPETNTPSKGFMLSFTDKEGKDNRHGIIDLETVADFEKTRKIAVKAKLPLLNNSKVIIIPLLNAKMHHVDLWDEQVRAKLLKRLSWIKNIKWGPHLRCFIDPAKNETNMLNGTENLRQYTPAINRDFAKWLKQKYKTVRKLRSAWKVRVNNFDMASRLIPLRKEYKLLMIDPQSGNILSADLKKTLAWLDYNEMIRETYAGYMDDLAINIKRMVNVPIVIKSVGVAGSRTRISRKYQGWDSTGFEVYFNQGFPPEAAGGASRAEAEASSHTMWKVGTELGNSAQVGNGKVKFFKDEKAIKIMARELSLSGVKGFYFFGIDLKPTRLWKNHNYHDFQKGLKWVGNISREYSNTHRTATPSSFTYPGGFCYWWWTTRNKAVYSYEGSSIAQSVRIKGDEWASNTNVLPKKFNRVVVNCPYPPFSIRYAPEINRIIKEKRKVIYLGERTDLGTISRLDKYFTKSVIKFKDGSTAQVLRILPGVKVLASERDKPWAIRHGNLMIVSRTPVTPGKYNQDAGFKYLKKAWID